MTIYDSSSNNLWLWIGLVLGVAVVIFVSVRNRKAALSVIERWAQQQNHRIVQVRRLRLPVSADYGSEYLFFRIVLRNQNGEERTCRLRILKFNDNPNDVQATWE